MTAIKNQSVIVDTTNSQCARLKPVPLSAVSLNDMFWQPRRKINQQVMLSAQYQLCENTGRIDNFRRAAGRKDIDFQGQYFNDSDVYKWLESAAWSLANLPNPQLETLIDELIDIIAAAQQPDGYLNTYFMFERVEERWINFSLHELYCAGHLFQAAVAFYRTTGKEKLLEVSTRFADYLYNRFGNEEDGKAFGTSGHPEIEMALVELYRTTQNERYLKLAQYFVDARGSGRVTRYKQHPNPEYHQDRVPFQEMSRLEGHAVRAVYLNCGATDVLTETGETGLEQALNTMWDNMATRQMYLTGGLGPRYTNEGFGRDYELRNDRAHSETCAAVANIMWNWRMLLLTGEARYADLMEQTLFNGALAGVSLDGKGYFYQNPLSDAGTHRRQEWFTTACCPGNISRLLSSLPGYFYSTSNQGVWVHLFATNQATLSLSNGNVIDLMMIANYPWSGDITLRIDTPGHFALFLRLPGWCSSGWQVTVNGDLIQPGLTEGNYLQIEHEWQSGDTVTLNLPMPVRMIESNPNIVENQGRIALMRGPLLYCVEAVDHGGFDVRRLIVPPDANFDVDFYPDLLNGVSILRGAGLIADEEQNWGDQLYRERLPNISGTYRTVELTAIPYYAWANREAGPMQVWLRTLP